MACVGKYDDGKAREREYGALPSHNVHRTACGHGVSAGEVVDDQNHQVRDRYQCNDRSVLQAVQPAQKRKGYHDEPIMLC